ncbi:MAG: NuoM family protein [Bacteroidota bacterium]
MNLFGPGTSPLTILILLPFVGALIAVLTKGNTRTVALAFSMIELLLSLVIAAGFDPQGGRQFVDNCPWIPALGISWSVGADGISLLLVLLTNILVPLIILSSFGREIKQTRLYYPLMLTMQSALVGVFCATDGFLFYVFWELALIPIYLICLNWGGADRQRITLKFFIYTLFGSLLMLVAFIWLRGATVGQDFAIDSFYALDLSSPAQSLVFWALFLAFAIKMPIFPLHTWQPDTYTDSPTQGTMLLSGIMLKMGVYGILRWLLPIVPGAFAEWGDIAMWLSVAGIVYASLVAWMQNDFKRLVAYSSIAHVGMIAAGVFSLTKEGLQGSVVQMLSHGVNVVGLFFIADILINRSGTRELDKLGGIRQLAPAFSTAFLVVLLGSVALPLTNGFIGEFMLLNGIFKYSGWIATVAGLSVILGAVYMLNAYRLSMLGETNPATASFTDLTNSEKAVLYPIVALIFLFGVYPEPIIRIVGPSIDALHQLVAGSSIAPLQ